MKLSPLHRKHLWKRSLPQRPGVFRALAVKHDSIRINTSGTIAPGRMNAVHFQLIGRFSVSPEQLPYISEHTTFLFAELDAHIFAPWPWYILFLEFIGLAMFFAVLLPFLVLDRIRAGKGYSENLTRFSE